MTSCIMYTQTHCYVPRVIAFIMVISVIATITTLPEDDHIVMVMMMVMTRLLGPRSIAYIMSSKYQTTQQCR